jgi:hypothetical protein
MQTTSHDNTREDEIEAMFINWMKVMIVFFGFLICLIILMLVKEYYPVGGFG